MMKSAITLAVALLVILASSGCAERTAYDAGAPDEVPQPADTVLPDMPSVAPPLPESGAVLEQEAIPFRFTRGNFPRLDGSVAMAPLGEAIACVLLGEPRSDVSELINFKKTTTAYINLVRRDGFNTEYYADIIIAGEPNWDFIDWVYNGEEVKDMLEIAPIALDALVFVVSESNPVNNLTTGQIQKIYTGSITNWEQVGGNDIEIVAFQCSPGAGSQVRMEELVMRGIRLAPAPSASMVGTMGELITNTRSFDGSAPAIGYTAYYYAKNINMADGLKILSVDGVAPNDGTIANMEYPFVGFCYAAIRKDAAPGSPERILHNWLLGEGGRALVKREGYVPVEGQ